MSGDRSAPERSTPLDGLKPTDFVRQGRWPDGALDIPQALRGKGLTREQLAAHVGAMEELRQLALDYRRYVAERETTNETVAKRLGLSVGALRNLRTGSAMPSARTLLLLRYLVPTSEQMNAGDYRDSWMRRLERNRPPR